MNEIKKKFNNYNQIKFYLNQKEEEIFYLMTQSDILIFNESSFPFTASLYCDGIIIKNLNDNYFVSAVKFKNIIFLNNYIFIKNINDLKKNNNNSLIKKNIENFNK